MAKDNIRALLGFNYFIVYNVDLEKWCEKYGLTVHEAECPDCGKNKIANIPFAGPDDIRGLLAKRCECGSEYDSFSYVGGMLKDLV